jgi:large conductance mechanosensitive channel
MSDIFKGFREFLLRGNIVELAVAFVMGLAVVNLINNFTASFIDPIVRVVLGASDTSAGGRIHLKGANYLDFAGFINAVITFVVIAAVLYFVFVLAIGKLRAHHAAVVVESPSETELDLLRQIRDGLNRP